MARWMWSQFVWPNLLRPWLQRRALVLSSNSRVALAAAIEAARAGGPVTEQVIAAANGAVNDAICAELGAAKL